jgi:hypothetical protein
VVNEAALKVQCMISTIIGEREVPIRPGPKTTLVFSEGGAFDFWTLAMSGFGQQTGRCPVGSDPGERWRRMQGAKGYEKYFESARTFAVFLRPASADEVRHWLEQHPTEAQHLVSCEVDGKRLRLVQRNARLELEP